MSRATAYTGCVNFGGSELCLCGSLMLGKFNHRDTETQRTHREEQGTVTAFFASGIPFNGITLYSFRSVTKDTK
jgi:hypothetical protein